MQDRYTNDMLLPIEYPIGKAFTIYLKRLMLIIAIALINYIIFALVIVVMLKPFLLPFLSLLLFIVYRNRISLFDTIRNWFVSQITITSSMTYLSSLISTAAVSWFVLLSMRPMSEPLVSSALEIPTESLRAYAIPLPTENPSGIPSSEMVKSLDTTPTSISEICGSAVVISDLPLRIRSEASISSEIVGYLPPDSTVDIVCEAFIYADGYRWIRVRVDDFEGYVASEFLSDFR